MILLPQPILLPKSKLGTIWRYAYILMCLLVINITPINAQDTLDFNKLISGSSGVSKTVKYKSELTGGKQTLSLPDGTWIYTDDDGNVLKSIDYRVDKYNKVSLLHGQVSYFHPSGYELLTLKYANNQLVSSKAFNIVVIYDGLRTIQVTEQFGAYTVNEFNTKSGDPRAKTKVSAPVFTDIEGYKTYEKSEGDQILLRPQSFGASYSTNHMSNPMIENHPKIFYSFNGIGDLIPGWSVASPSPDFIVSRTSFSGDACLGFRTYSHFNDIEYLRNTLVQPLKKDSLYCYSMKVLLAPLCSLATNELSVYFSKKEEQINEKNPIKPQMVFNQSFLIYKTQWMTLQCVYKSTGGEKFVSLGTFKTLEQMKLNEVKGVRQEAYYYLDDVSLVPIKSEDECPCTQPQIDEIVPEVIEYQPGQVFVLNGVFFDNDKDILLPQSVDTLNKLLNVLITYPTMNIELSGHTSSVGGYEHNMDLSRRRAEAVKLFLTKAGIVGSRIETVGFGPNKPIATNETEEGQSLNRRVEVKILGL